MKKLRVLLAVVLIVLGAKSYAKENVIEVKAGDANSLREAIAEANRTNADSLSERLYILIPDGLYDLGEEANTAITGHNIALIGQSMGGTVIRNAPPKEKEGIQTTSTLRNLATGTFLQDLTLQNALDYYGAGAAGRGVCYQDKGTRSILNRVRMLSYQDTYYTDNVAGQSYLLNSEIHGTVDFICGAGDAYFDHCTIVTERRNRDGKGETVIAAPRTADTPWGYVFEGCTVYNRVSKFFYARGWHTHPRCAFLNTTLMSPELLKPTRYDARGMRTVNSDFFEYNTTDAQGHDITPASNVVTFTLKEEQNPVETIITASQAKRYRLKSIFPDWRPEKKLARMSRQAELLKKQKWGVR
ncbi:MAG: hypothetical protein IJ569_04740 [Prevotella sp.]|nr:hypothetical protein [Prevotella sp.]